MEDWGDCWVYGDERAKNWTLNYFGNKKTIQNPLRQNYQHKMSLSKYLNIDEDKINSIVMVWGKCEFKTRRPKNVISGGIQGDTDYIKGFSEVVFTDEEVINICNKIKALSTIRKRSNNNPRRAR